LERKVAQWRAVALSAGLDLDAIVAYLRSLKPVKTQQ
jgi:hypothetical protein